MSILTLNLCEFVTGEKAERKAVLVVCWLIWHSQNPIKLSGKKKLTDHCESLVSLLFASGLKECVLIWAMEETFGFHYSL